MAFLSRLPVLTDYFNRADSLAQNIHYYFSELLNMNTCEFEQYLKTGVHGHLVGIGGVSMSPLAEVLHSMGLHITGSDMNNSPTVQHLRGLGIEIAVGHDAANISGADFVVRTAAARDDNVEIKAARAAGVPVFERAQAWGCIMRGYKNALCIAGTHGKTTTTSMATHILMAAGADPTVMIGGTLPMLHAGHRVGHGDTIVLESCEYYNSFHSFFPTIAVILNIEADHLDFFKDLEDVKQSFQKFASLVPESGHIICNADDANTMDALRPLGRELLTFGLSSSADVRAVNIDVIGGCHTFDVLYKGVVYAHVDLHIPGNHNIMNALAAAAAAIVLGLPGSAVQQGLGSFSGAGRRFEYKGCVGGADIYDDYAHHPGELHALLEAVRTLDYKRIILAFQPHTYTRTKTLFNDFKTALAAADVLFLAEIFAAREKNTIGISSKDLADAIPGAVFCPTFSDLEREIRAIAAPGDIILTVGAGNIYKVGEALAER
jgi:UDP-N-acetylmuramate--alanine ligase